MSTSVSEVQRLPRGNVRIRKKLWLAIGTLQCNSTCCTNLVVVSTLTARIYYLVDQLLCCVIKVFFYKCCVGFLFGPSFVCLFHNISMYINMLSAVLLVWHISVWWISLQIFFFSKFCFCKLLKAMSGVFDYTFSSYNFKLLWTSDSKVDNFSAEKKFLQNKKNCIPI